MGSIYLITDGHNSKLYTNYLDYDQNRVLIVSMALSSLQKLIFKTLVIKSYFHS